MHTPEPVKAPTQTNPPTEISRFQCKLTLPGHPGHPGRRALRPDLGSKKLRKKRLRSIVEKVSKGISGVKVGEFSALDQGAMRLVGVSYPRGPNGLRMPAIMEFYDALLKRETELQSVQLRRIQRDQIEGQEISRFEISLVLLEAIK
jgi:hypothetical protein